jgi:hypothetical protein
VVEQHRADLERGESLFDRDLRLVLALAREGVGRLSAARRGRLVSGESHESEE